MFLSGLFRTKRTCKNASKSIKAKKSIKGRKVRRLVNLTPYPFAVCRPRKKALHVFKIPHMNDDTLDKFDGQKLADHFYTNANKFINKHSG